MKNKKKCIMFIITFSCIVLLAGIVFRVIYVNVNAYSLSEKTYAENEWVPLEGDFINSDQENTVGYSIKVGSAEILSYVEFMNKFNKNEDYLAENSKQNVLLLKVDIRNSGNIGGYIYIRDCNIFNEYLSRYFEKSDIYMAIANPRFNQKLDVVAVKTDTKSSMYWVYTMEEGVDSSNYLDKNKHLDTLKLYLNVSLYPTRKMIELDVDMSL